MSAAARPPIENPQTAIAAVKMLLGTRSVPRLAMQGTSMLPLLREPMVLELEPVVASPARGDILVFEDEGKLVAHRVTKVANGIVETCGDARPWSPEYPAFATFVGKVKSVLASDAPEARRVDTGIFHLRGALYARTRALRALPFRATAQVRRVANAIPWRRKRPYLALIDLMAATVRNDPIAFRVALDGADMPALAATARRHGCTAMLLEALRAFQPEGFAAAYLRQSLQRGGRSAVLLSLVAKSSVAAVVTALGKSGVPFALLKGAARLYGNEAGATLHASGDFDVLVPPDRLEGAIAALREEGYGERQYAAKRQRYLEHHHHAAPLFPPGLGFAVELHTALARPGTLSTALDWEALRHRMVPVDGPAGTVLCLDREGTALHLGVHAIGLHRLRDSVLLAQLLGVMTPQERAGLHAAVAQERIDQLRLGASFAFASRLAGVPWPSNVAVDRYLDWVGRREDVPLYFAQRSQLAEGWYAADRRFTRLGWQVLDPRSGLDEEPRARSWWRISGRVLAGACALGYARSMRARP